MFVEAHGGSTDISSIGKMGPEGVEEGLETRVLVFRRQIAL